MSSFSSPPPPPPRVVLFCVLLLFPISRTFPRAFFVQFTFFLSRSLSLSEKRRKRRLLLATVTSVAGMKSSIVCARSLSLSLCVSESGDKESEFKTSAFFSIPNERETLQNASKFAFLHGTNNTEDFCAQKEDKRERERDDDDATRREEASPRVHRPDAFLFFFFFIFHPRRGRIFAL